MNKSQVPERIQVLIDDLSSQWYFLGRSSQVFLDGAEAWKVPTAVRTIITMGAPVQQEREKVLKHTIEFEKAFRVIVNRIEQLISFDETNSIDLGKFIGIHQMKAFGDEYKLLFMHDNANNPYSLTLQEIYRAFKLSKDYSYKNIQQYVERYERACMSKWSMLGKRALSKIKSLETPPTITNDEKALGRFIKVGGVLNTGTGALGLLLVGSNPVSATCFLGGLVFTAYGDKLSKAAIRLGDRTTNALTKAINNTQQRAN